MGNTTISCYNDSHTFTTQSSSTFTFLAGTVSYNPDDILPGIPPTRATRKATIGGSNVSQLFCQCESDTVLTFTALLTYAEIQDMIGAMAKLATWEYKDYLGGSYIVLFSFTDGLTVDSKIRSNDRFYCRFKFLVESMS